ncbi:MAG: LacI family transcriptional regulator [Anaerolineae bacterium]|nr:LacI family transcriptional regulator [Anaerolineae bacterium]
MPDTSEVTIFDVAQAAGVSITTVSRILNNKPDVSAATRQRVQQVIEELGYHPHAQARRLAARKSRTIALLFPLDRAVGQLELDFIVGAAAAAGAENFFFYFVTTPITESSLLGLYRSAQIDGAILMEIHTQDWRVELLRAYDYPFVMIGHCANNTGLSFVDLDFEESIILAFDHLVELGHREIGFLGQPQVRRQQGYGPAVRCWAGYERALQKHNLTPIYHEERIDVQALFDATLKLLEERPHLTAIVATQGAPTVGVIRALRQAGRAVPDEFSVVGITTENVAELITPPLTTINFPAYTEGLQAAKMLISQLNQKPLENKQILLPPQLIIRKSTGPVREGSR